MPRRNLIAIVSFALVSLACYQKARYSRYAAIVADAMGQIVDRYVEPVGRRSLFEGAMEGMLGRLDEYSGYVDEKALRQLYESIIEQEFGGVGIEVGVDPDTNRLTVLSPLVNTPVAVYWRVRPMMRLVSAGETSMNSSSASLTVSWSVSATGGSVPGIVAVTVTSPAE